MQTSTPSRSRNPLATMFTDHPASVGESYLQHMGFALRFSGLLAVAALAALIHALLPGLCRTTASRITKRLHARITGRGPA